MFGFSLSVSIFINGPLRGSSRWLRQQKGSGWRLKGRLFAPVPGLLSRHTWSVRSMYSVVPQSRPSLQRAERDTERNIEGIDGALSAGVTGENSPRGPYLPVLWKNREARKKL